MTFRKDINGLRAIAVLGVLIFHFFPDTLPGGFAGVDVFFVISGFLMTGIIFRGIEKNNFSLGRFYSARANRILPELVVVCTVVLVIGFFFVTPLAYKSLAKHALGSITFLSNFIYTFESGYFDMASHDKWLLHTWSLSTEWQFYIVYPLAIIFFLKVAKISLKNIAWGIVFFTGVSFIFSVITSSIWPSAAYFCLPTRLWELTIGGLAFLYPWKLEKTNGIILQSIGFILIVCAYFIISEESVFPGYLALLPTLGAFFIIQAQRENFITNNVICQKMGEWSYSIYLWHYPLTVVIFSFALPSFWKIPFLLASIVLGYFSNKYIANKNNNQASMLYYRPVFASILAFCMVAVTTDVVAKFKFKDEQSFALYKDLMKSKPYTLAKYNLNYTDYKKPYVKGSTCSFDKQMPIQYAFQCVENIIKDKGWLIIGDSHGRDFYHSLELAYPEKNIAMLQQSSCAPAKAVKQNTQKVMCFREMDKIIEFINANSTIEKVIFAARYTDESGTAAFMKQINSNLYKRELIVVNSGVHFDRDVSSYLHKYGVQEYYPIEAKFIKPKQHINFDISHLNRPNIKIFDKYHVFCNAQDHCKLLDNFSVLYIDNQHLSEKGMFYLADKIKQSRIMDS